MCPSQRQLSQLSDLPWAGEQLVDPLGSSLAWDEGTGFRFKVQLWTRSCAEGHVKE